MAEMKRMPIDRFALVKSCAATLELMRVHTSRANLGESESAQEFRDFLDLCWLAAARLQEDLVRAPYEGVGRAETDLRNIA